VSRPATGSRRRCCRTAFGGPKKKKKNIFSAILVVCQHPLLPRARPARGGLSPAVRGKGPSHFRRDWGRESYPEVDPPGLRAGRNQVRSASPIGHGRTTQFSTRKRRGKISWRASVNRRHEVRQKHSSSRRGRGLTKRGRSPRFWRTGIICTAEPAAETSDAQPSGVGTEVPGSRRDLLLPAGLGDPALFSRDRPLRAGNPAGLVGRPTSRETRCSASYAPTFC